MKKIQRQKKDHTHMHVIHMYNVYVYCIITYLADDVLLLLLEHYTPQDR